MFDLVYLGRVESLRRTCSSSVKPGWK